MTGCRTTIFSATLGEDGRTEPPLGALYIASALEDLGWTIDFRDFQLALNASIYDIDAMCIALEGHERILMISCFVDMLPIVLAATERLKEQRPDTYIILGGPGPTAKAVDLVQRFSHLDAIVMGEGEATIQDWAQQFEVSAALRNEIPGMVLRDNKRILVGAERARLSYNAIGRPAFHLVDWPHYVAARVVTTRGCPYHCSFCDVAPLWGRKATYRDLDATVEEMIELRDRYGVNNIAIADDTFVLNRDRVKEFCSILIERDANINWGCFGRINLMSGELIELMARAGCRGVFYGIDSGSPSILKLTSKELEADSIIPVLRISAQHFEFVEASFIWGYPTETLADFEATMRLASEASLLAPIVNVQLHLLSPLPSSPMYKNFAGALVLPEADDKRWLLLPGVMLDARAKDLRELVLRDPDLFPGFFSFPTVDKPAKVSHLNEVLSSIEQVVGRALVDASVHSLLSRPSRQTELALLRGAKSPAEVIGTGLALVLFQRARSKGTARTAKPIERPPALARRRSDSGLVQIL